MQLPRRRPHPRQPRLPFMDPSQAKRWLSLSLEQQRTCQELLSQLLQQILRHPNDADQSDKREDDHERQTSA